MPFVNGTFVPWGCYLGLNETINGNNTCYLINGTVKNITNIGQIPTSISSALPWFWPIIPFGLYLYLIIIFNESPTKGKFLGIAALVMVISIFMATGQLIQDAVLNIIIFMLAAIGYYVFKS
jgi:hypothetical protein